jgi:arginyl-tRNA synthetase
LAQLKFKDFESLKRSIYVVAAEQADHFKALFHILDALGYAWANNCYHLGYGMILIKGGKLKSREGITADADQTIDLLEEMAYDEVHKRN